MARVTWSVPLPGPFRVSGRVGGQRRSSDAGPVITALAYLIAGSVALVVIVGWALAVGAKALWNLVVLAVRAARGGAR
jgi:hypothetical protein